MMTTRPHAHGLFNLDLLGSVLLLTIALVACFYAGVLYEGKRMGEQSRQEIADMAQRTQRQITWTRDAAAQQQLHLQATASQLQHQLLTTQGQANEKHQTFTAGVRAGTVGVRVPIVPASCPAQHVQPTRATTAAPAATHAQLEPAAAADLADIAHDGDAAIRELNTCIAQYEDVRNAIAQWRNTLKQLDAEHAQTP